MFDVFTQKLTKIDSDATPDQISKWKNSKETKHCYECLNEQFPETGHTYISEIISRVFLYNPTKNDKLFTIAICTYLLDKSVPKIIVDGSIIEKRMKSIEVIVNIFFFVSKLLNCNY